MANRNNSVIVIDIGSKLTLLNVELKGRIKISAFKSVDLPKEKNQEVVLKAMQDFISANNIRQKNAILRPTLSSLFIKRLQMSAVPDKELAEAIKWQIKESVPYDLSGAILDYSINKKTVREDGVKLLDVICAVAQTEEVKNWVLLLKQAGLSCLFVGLIPFGYEKIIPRQAKEEKGSASCVLHMDDDNCYVFIYQDNKLDFYRELPISINKLREAMKVVLASNAGKIELLPNEIEEILFKVGMPKEDYVYNAKINAAQILSMLRPVWERLIMEIKRSFIFYQSQFNTVQVKNVIIAGALTNIAGVEDFLGKELPYKIDKIYLGDKVELPQDIDAAAVSQINACLGLTIDYKNSLNLLPYEFRTEKIETVQKASIRWVAFIVFLLFTSSFILAKASINSYNRRLDNARLYLNVLSEVKDTKAKIDQLDNFIGGLKNSHYPLAGMLKKLSNIAPADLFILDFSLDSDSASGSMKGFVKNRDNSPNTILTQFINNMKKSIYFSEVSIISAEKGNYEGVEVTNFSIDFKLS